MFEIKENKELFYTVMILVGFLSGLVFAGIRNSIGDYRNFFIGLGILTGVGLIKMFDIHDVLTKKEVSISMVSYLFSHLFVHYVMF